MWGPWKKSVCFHYPNQTCYQLWCIDLRFVLRCNTLWELGEGIPPSPTSAWCWAGGLQRCRCLTSHCPGSAACCDLLTQVPSEQEHEGHQAYQRPAAPSPPSATLECFPAPTPLSGGQPASFNQAGDFLVWYLIPACWLSIASLDSPLPFSFSRPLRAWQPQTLVQQRCRGVSAVAFHIWLLSCPLHCPSRLGRPCTPCWAKQATASSIKLFYGWKHLLRVPGHRGRRGGCPMLDTSVSSQAVTEASELGQVQALSSFLSPVLVKTMSAAREVDVDWKKKAVDVILLLNLLWQGLERQEKKKKRCDRKRRRRWEIAQHFNEDFSKCLTPCPWIQIFFRNEHQGARCRCSRQPGDNARYPHQYVFFGWYFFLPFRWCSRNMVQKAYVHTAHRGKIVPSLGGRWMGLWQNSFFFFCGAIRNWPYYLK